MRVLDFFDVMLADKFTRHISTRIVEHAAKLDLTSYEDPVFYDKMERARVQGTDRLIMIQAQGVCFSRALPQPAWRPASSFFRRGFCWRWSFVWCRLFWAKRTSLFSATR